MNTSSAALAAALLLVAAASPSLAQAPRAPARGAPPQAAQPPAPPPVFPCRTQAETCFLAVPVGGQALVLFTNAQNGQGIDAKPIDVAGPDGAKIDLAPHAGRVLMLVGAYEPATGLTKAELVEVASPLVSLTVKAQLAAGGEEPPAKGGGAPPRRR